MRSNDPDAGTKRKKTLSPSAAAAVREGIRNLDRTVDELLKSNGVLNSLWRKTFRAFEEHDQESMRMVGQAVEDARITFTRALLALKEMNELNIALGPPEEKEAGQEESRTPLPPEGKHGQRKMCSRERIRSFLSGPVLEKLMEEFEKLN